MKKAVTMPPLRSSAGSDKVRILRWITSEGDEAKKGRARLEAKPDKVNVDVAAPDDRAVYSIRANAGGLVKFGAGVTMCKK